MWLNEPTIVIHAVYVLLVLLCNTTTVMALIVQVIAVVVVNKIGMVHFHQTGYFNYSPLGFALPSQRSTE